MIGIEFNKTTNTKVTLITIIGFIANRYGLSKGNKGTKNTCIRYIPRVFDEIKRTNLLSCQLNLLHNSIMINVIPNTNIERYPPNVISPE